jgi:hypothetical protein
MLPADRRAASVPPQRWHGERALSSTHRSAYRVQLMPSRRSAPPPVPAPEPSSDEAPPDLAATPDPAAPDDAAVPSAAPISEDIASGHEGRTAWAPSLELARRVRVPVVRVLSLSWVPLTAAFLSLILSIASIVISLRQPEVLLILPDQVRVAQGRGSGSAFVYLQPAFVSTGQNDRVEVIRDMTLQVQPASGAGVSFRWDEQARLVGDADSGTLSYQYVADAVPLLESPRSASAPLCLFDAPDGWFFAPGTYTFTLVADRVVSSDPIRDSFAVALSAVDIAFLDGPGAEQFLSFPIR